MKYLSKEEIQKLAERIKQSAAGATLSVSSKGGGMNLGNLRTTLTAPKAKLPGLGGEGFAKGIDAAEKEPKAK